LELQSQAFEAVRETLSELLDVPKWAQYLETKISVLSGETKLQVLLQANREVQKPLSLLPKHPVEYWQLLRPRWTAKQQPADLLQSDYRDFQP
jgi:hypothetical protein